MLRRIVINGITYHVQIIGKGGVCSNGWDFTTGRCVYIEGMDKPTMDVRRAEALAEIGRGRKIA